MTALIAPMLVSTAMRPVTAQADDSASMASTASSQFLPWPPYCGGDRHADQLRVLQQLDIVPGILLGAVDLGGAAR